MQVIPAIHTTPDTAYVVDDYPYGFRLRCKIRYWIEYKPKHGFRAVSQTTNSKLSTERWNKPKASAYARFGLVMYLDEQSHVCFAGLSEYSGYAEANAFLEKYSDGIGENGRCVLINWIDAKRSYEEKIAAGVDWRDAGRQVAIERARQEIAEAKQAA